MTRIVNTGTMGRRLRGQCFLIAALAIGFSNYIEQVASLPVEAINQWPTFPRRNIAALARAGYLKPNSFGYKRSISTLAKNGQLPTFRSPYTDGVKQDNDEEESSQEKRNMASIARLRSYTAMKRNVQALARDGYRVGRGQYNPNEKRNIASMARNGMFGKRDIDSTGDEYYYPFYQNPLPPLSEIDGPFDYNELYDLQQSVNPDMFPPLSQVYKRSGFVPFSDFDADEPSKFVDNWSWKRGAYGMPVHGLYRPNYIDPTVRTKRYIMSMPDAIDGNEIDKADENEDKRSVDKETRDNFEKRHIGSLARLGLLPSFRFSGGRYSRSGRARLLWPSQELYRSPRLNHMKHSNDQNFGIREYITDPQVKPIDSDDTDLPPPTVFTHSHPTGRLLHRPVNNEIPNTPNPDAIRPRWQQNINTKESPKFYYFRSLKVPFVPYHSSKRYLIQPAVDNILLRKGYRQGNLPSRMKNQ